MGDNEFASKISNLLAQGNTVNALNLFSDNKNNEEIRNNSWDLVPVICGFLTEECRDERIEVFKCCQKLVDVIAEESKPDEVLLQFIEEIEIAKDDIKFLAMLKPVEKVLLRVPDKRIMSLAWCLNAIKCYLKKLELPDHYNLSSDERLLLDGDDTVGNITDLYTDILSFSETFIEELMELKDCNIQERRQVLAKFLVDLLDKPLGYLLLDSHKNTIPKSRILADRIVFNILKIYPDPFKFFQIDKKCSNADLIKPSDVGLGVFFSLLLPPDSNMIFPHVYSKIFLLQHCLKLVNVLFKIDHQFVLERAVQLVDCLLKDFDYLEVPYLVLELKEHSIFCKALSYIIIHNESKILRGKALKSLEAYIRSFDHQGRYCVIINLFQSLSHSGLKGHIITLYKQMFADFVSLCNWACFPTYYKGQKFLDLLQVFTRLERKEETDIVDESDEIISTLNFLRFIVQSNLVSDYEPLLYYIRELPEYYLEPLRRGIKLSKEHYNLKFKELEESEKQSDCKVSVTVSGKNLWEMPTEQKNELLNLSLTTLDLVDSLLNRVVELMEKPVKA